MEPFPPDSGWPPSLPPLEDPQFQLDPTLDFGVADMQFGAAGGLLPLQDGAAPPPLPAAAAGAAPSAAAAGSSGGRGRGRQGRGAAVDDEKLEKARAANRAKQARFRARQKEKKEQLERDYETTTVDLERERDLNARMRLSNQVLEAVSEQKDAALQVLASASGRAAGPGWQQEAQPPAADGQLQQAADGKLQAAAISAAAQQFRRMPYRERVAVCASIFQATEGAKRTLKQQAGSLRKLDGFALDTTLKHTVGSQLVEAHPELLEAALAMTAEEVVQDWTSLAECAAEVVRAVDSGQMSEEEAEDAMRPAVLYQTIKNTLMVTRKPEAVQVLVAYKRFRGESEAAAKARWRKVVVDMGVTEAQVRAVLPHYQAYCARLERLGEEVASSLATLQEVQQSLNGQLSQLNSASLSSLVHEYLGLFEAATSLSQGPTAALLALLDLYSHTASEVTPLQKTRMAASCRPLHPDVVAIVQEALDMYGLLPAGPPPPEMPALPAPQLAAEPAGPPPAVEAGAAAGDVKMEPPS